MLSLLRIKNLAIIDQIELELHPGLSAITGETGAGKSVILRAIELLLGKRSSGDIVRGGKGSCEVEGLFTLTPAIRESLQGRSDDFSDLDEEVILRRVVDATGKSRFYLNGRLVPASVVQQFSAAIIDFTGQHQQQMLFSVDSHREFLDASGVDPELRSQVRSEFLRYRDLSHRLSQLRDSSSLESKRLQVLEEEARELTELKLAVGERSQIEAEMAKLSSVEQLRELVNQSFALVDADEESVLARLRKVKSLIAAAENVDEATSGIAELLDSAQVTLDESALAMERYLNSLDENPLRLEELRERLSSIARAERKYGRSCDELVAYGETINRELASLGGAGVDVQRLERELTEIETRLRSLESKLHQLRVKVAGELAVRIASELQQVALPKARFVVDVQSGESSVHGADRVRFLFSANPGSEPAPLDAVASGGELSRVLLVLKSVLSESAGAPVQIYDEVDVGIGGAVAHVVGEKLRQISKQAQVILVTHAPQIASLADVHYCVEKRLGKDETKVGVRELDRSGRVREVARMLAGKTITVEFEASAQELLRGNAAASVSNASVSNVVASAAQKKRPKEKRKDGS